MEEQFFRVDVEKALSANAFTRDDYVFAGWNTEYDGTGKAYADGATVKNLSTEDKATVYLYAQWLQADTVSESYTVQFDTNDGTERGFSQTLWTGAVQALSANSFTRSGYTFVGWNTQTDGGGITYGDGALVKNLAASGETITLYAQWVSNESAPATYTVTFDANGGSGYMASQTFFIGVTQALSVSCFTYPYNDNYIFAGWNTQADGTVSPYADHALVKDLATTAGASVTLYAQWIDNAIIYGSYTVIFDANGGEGTMSAQTCTVGIQQWLDPNAFTRSGYRFAGWNTKADGGGDSYGDGSSIYQLSEAADTTITLYAQWRLTTYYITFDSNGGSGNMEVQTYSAGNIVTLAENAFTRAGYTFKCWNTAADGSGETSYSNFYNSSVENVTLYAHWTANTYYIDFDRNEGSYSYMSFLTCTVGTPQTLPASTFTRTNYAFAGWNTAQDGTGTAYADEATVLNLTLEAGKTVTLYAQWSNIYYVTFKANGGTGNMETQTFAYGTSQALSVNAFTRSGYAFAGWNTAADGSGTRYANGASVKNLTEAESTLTLYAQWETGQGHILYAEDLAVITTDSIASYNDPCTIRLFGAWTNYQLSTLSKKLADVSGKHITLDMTQSTGITSINDRMFKDCTSLVSITIPSSVTSIGEDTFYGCTSLTSVTIPSSVTSIGSYTFRGCTSLTSITIPSRGIGKFAFYGCTSLSDVTILDSVTSIGDYAFEDCTSLTGITIPDSVTDIGDGAFGGCTSLTSITIPDSVTYIGHSVFSDCTNCVISAGANIVSKDYTSQSSPFSGGKGVIIRDGAESIGNYVFYGCTSLADIPLPSTVKSIGMYAFQSCTSLTSITIPDGVTSISGAFYGCRSLESVTIPASVTYIGGAFYGCTSLASVTIPDGVTRIHQSTFASCKSLTSITIPSGVTSIDERAFAGCTLLKSVTIPDSVTRIYNYAFNDCTSLTSITIPLNVNKIGFSAFYGCSNLTSVIFRDTTTWYYAKENFLDIYTDGTPLASADIASSSTAATYLRTKYCFNCWYKE